jgi:hypothetical protein
MHRALAVDEFGLGVERLAARAVQPHIDALVDLAAVVDALDELLDRCFVPRVGGANEEVVRSVDPLRHLFERGSVPVDELLHVQPRLRGDARDIRPVLVGAS